MIRDLYAIYSIWLREMLRFFRLKSRLFGSIASPFFFLAFLGMGFGNGASLPGIPQGVGYVSFLTPGIIGMTLLFSATFAGLSVLWDREFGFLKEIMVSPVSRIAIVLGRTAGGLTTGILQAIIIMLSGILLGMTVPSLEGFLLSLVFMVLIATTFIGLGLAFASKMEDMSGFSLIMNFLIFPLFFLSGALFPLDRFPASHQGSGVFQSPHLRRGRLEVQPDRHERLFSCQWISSFWEQAASLCYLWERIYLRRPR